MVALRLDGHKTTGGPRGPAWKGFDCEGHAVAAVWSNSGGVRLAEGEPF